MFLLALSALSFGAMTIIGGLILVVIIAIALFEEKDNFNIFAGLGLFALIAYCFSLGTGSPTLDISETSKLIISTTTHANFWEYLAGYLICGVIYFFPQMWVTIRKAARKYAEFAAKNTDTRYGFAYKFMQVEASRNSDPEGTFSRKDPTISKASLSYWMTSWVVYWPFYLINLVFGDLLKEIARWVVDKMHGRLTIYVKNAFADAMK